MTKDKCENKCVIRLSTSAWSDRRGVHLKKSVSFLRRKSFGFNVIEEDCGNLSALEVISGITNLDNCRDGVYEVVVCNESRDWETNSVEDWEYKLIRVDG